MNKTGNIILEKFLIFSLALVFIVGEHPTTLLAGGDAKDMTPSANVGESALKYNRRLHPEELKYIKALQEGKTPEEQARYAAAALNLVKGDKGISEKDSDYQTVKNITEVGGGYAKEQQELLALAKADGNENAFTYGFSDSVSDFVSRNNEIVSRATGGVKFGLGSVGVMASAGLGTAAVPITGGTSAVIASVTGTGSVYYAYDGYNQAFGSYTSSEGAKVLQSANVPTDSFALEKGKDLAIDTGIAVTGAVAIKGLSVAGSKVLESNSAQKVKSVLFKGKEGTNVATKTTTTKLTTSPDSSSLYDSETSTRIGISEIDKKDKRVHEVLGGYGENISAKDFKLQVQAEKALDAHAKKTASGVGKNSKTSKGEVSGIGGKKIVGVEHSKPNDFSVNYKNFKTTEWTSPSGTKQTYKVHQRDDINWDLVRTNPKGPVKYIGKTNREAAQAGQAPELIDGSKVNLHHIGQNSKGPLVEVGEVTHKKGHKILHQQHGVNKGHPEHPVDHGNKWQTDVSNYWKNRIKNDK